jgi:hypothetical protein
MIGQLEAGLAAHGLALLGGFVPEPADGVPGDPAALLLVGNVGSTIHPHLQAAPERHGPHPLDRWTRRVVAEVAAPLGAACLFPFDGPPFFPFQRWAVRADGRFSASPLGLLIHERYGLWAALRAALLLDHPVLLPRPEAMGSPCPACTGRPCLSACPVGAFQPGSYQVAACRAHLGTLSGQDCMMGGCLARRACPVGRSYAYDRAHAAFHMRAFRVGGG